MKRVGQVAVLRFPEVDLTPGKPRPVLLLAPVPGPYDDWLVCMISTQLQQAMAGFDEVLEQHDPDFDSSGLKIASVVRVARLAVVPADMLMGGIGEIGPERLDRIKRTIADWVRS